MKYESCFQHLPGDVWSSDSVLDCQALVLGTMLIGMLEARLSYPIA